MTNQEFLDCIAEIARGAGRHDIEVKLAMLDPDHAPLPVFYNSESKGEVRIDEMHTVHIINAVRYQRRLHATDSEPIVVALFAELGKRLVDGEAS